MLPQVTVIYAFVIFMLFQTFGTAIDFPQPLQDPLLEKYRSCLRDARGGVYDASLSVVSCEYVKNPTARKLRDVKCVWNSIVIVEVVFDATVSVANNSDNISANCSRVRTVTLRRHGEIVWIDLDLDVGMARLFRGPGEYMYWRQWLPKTSPIKITVEGLTEPLPSLRNYTQLKSFTLTASAEYYPKVTESTYNQTKYATPPLPSSLEELILEGNEIKNFPHPNNNTMPLLRRLSLARNRLSDTHFGNSDGNNYMKFAPTLEEIDFSYNVIVHMLFSDFQYFPKLHKLNMAHNRILFSFQSSNIPRNLVHLNISNNRELVDFKVTENKMIFSELQVLDISNTPSKVNETLVFSKITPKLKRLYISGYHDYHITNLTLDYLKMKIPVDIFPNITNSSINTLDLSGGKLRHIRNLGLNNTNLENLDISHNLISSWDNAVLFEADNLMAWVLNVNFSYNVIQVISRKMVLSLQPLMYIDLGANPFQCDNCSIETIQGWLPFHGTHVLNLDRHIPLMCGSPESMRSTPISDTTYYDNHCVDNTLVLATIPAIVVIAFIAIQVFLIYHYRLQIIYMFHVYKLRVRGIQENSEGCTHDVFVCYSSLDRPFVMDTLAPFLEAHGPENYKAYIHERSFTLGSDINTNIVEAIERSRHALLVVSQAFLKSEFCKREFNMVTHRAFDGNPGYMVILRYGSLRKEEIPRNLRMYMTTTTYLEWPHDPSEVERLEVRKRLVKALGKSLHQRAVEKADDLAEKKYHDIPVGLGHEKNPIFMIQGFEIPPKIMLNGKGN